MCVVSVGVRSVVWLTIRPTDVEEDSGAEDAVEDALCAVIGSVSKKYMQFMASAS
jgi:hypothetical protein